MSRSVLPALLLVVLSVGWRPAARAQPLAPLDATRSPPFTATLSNNSPLAIRMNVEDTSHALGTALNYVSDRPGGEIFLAFRNIGGSGLFLHKDRLYMQPRQAGRLERRLGSKLNVAVTARAASPRSLPEQSTLNDTNFGNCNPQQMDQPWDKISS